MEMQNNNGPSPQPAAPAVKRRRVALACDSCRTRKTRCDSVRPRCSSCTDLGFECVYTPPTSASNVIIQKDYLNDLEGRVKRLEESLTTVKNDLSGLTSRVDQGYDPKSKPDENVQQVSSMPDLVGTEDSVDAMGAITLANEEDSGFFGPSSNVAFLRHLSRAIVHSGAMHGKFAPLTPEMAAYDGGFVNASRPPSPQAQRGKGQFKRTKESIYTLPPQPETLKLIWKFFSDTGLLFPYIYPPTFLETYDQMVQENFTKVRRTWLGLLNMILAMATITNNPDNSPADSRMAESDVFYQRGLALCGNEILRGTTLEVVHYLLLMGQYLQGTQKSVQAWTVHGLAVKAALQLGLHSRDASQAFTPLEQEIRKRTWYGCVVLDRTLSMTFGRPAAIPDSYVKLDLPARNGLINKSAVVDDETAALSLSFYNATITLYKQTWSVLELLYGQNLGCDAPLTVSQAVAHVFSLEQHLFSWEKSLPASLQLLNSTALKDRTRGLSSDDKFSSWKFRVIITLRYLNVRVLLHRPVLVKFVDVCGGLQSDSQELRLLQQLGLNSMQICAESAMEIIDIVYEAVHGPGYHRNLLGAWWFSLYYTFNSALVILGVLLVCREENITGQPMGTLIDKAKLYPSRAVAALLKLDTGNRMVDRCRLYLEGIIRGSHISGDQDPIPGSTLGPYIGFDHPEPLSQAGEFDFSPLGMEFGEFMVDGDLLALINRTDGLGGNPTT